MEIMSVYNSTSVVNDGKKIYKSLIILLSKFLISELNKDYSSLSKTFSQNENITVEQFFILQKIEKVKELLLYNEFNLTEIAGKLGYKSVQHLSSQFKTITSFTPTEFKKLKVHNRKPLDKV